MANRNDLVMMFIGGRLMGVDRYQFVQGFLDDNGAQDNGVAAGTILRPPSAAPAGSRVNRNSRVVMSVGGQRVSVDRAGFVAFLNDAATQDNGTAAGSLILPPTAQPAGTYLVNRNDQVLMSDGGQQFTVDRGTFMAFLNDNVAQDNGVPVATITLPATGAGFSFDGASTAGHAPTLSNSNKTVAWPTITDGGTGTAYAVISSGSKATGKWYIRANLNSFAGTANPGSVGLGIADATINVNAGLAVAGSVWTLNANAVGSGYSFGNGGSQSPIATPSAAGGAEVIVFFDADAKTFGVITPDGLTHSMAGNITGASWVLVSDVAAVGGTISGGFTLLTSGTLTPPVGYSSLI